MRLLLAEDDLDISKAIVTIFEKNNYCTDAVYNGQDAYIYAAEGNYDGIVLDIMMPEMDGLEVLSRLRKEGISTPILLLTAKGELNDRVAGLDAGADDYLPKPFAASELLARVRAMLRRKGAVSYTHLDVYKRQGRYDFGVCRGQAGVQQNPAGMADA